jgi:hypothetical protein
MQSGPALAQSSATVVDLALTAAPDRVAAPTMPVPANGIRQTDEAI